MDACFDSSEYPLCRLSVGKAPSTEELTRVLGDYEDELGKRRRICVLADASVTTRLEIEQVKVIAKFGERNHEALAAHVGALAIAVPSAMVRGALKVAFQLKSPPHPYKIARSVKEAQAFLTPYIEQIRA